MKEYDHPNKEDSANTAARAHRHQRRARWLAKLTPLLTLGAGSAIGASESPAATPEVKDAAPTLVTSHELTSQSPEGLINSLHHKFYAEANRMIHMYESGDHRIKKFHDDVYGSKVDTYSIGYRDGTYHGKPTETVIYAQVLENVSPGPAGWGVLHHMESGKRPGDPVYGYVHGTSTRVGRAKTPMTGKIWSLVNIPGGVVGPKTRTYAVSEKNGAQITYGPSKTRPASLSAVESQFNKFLKQLKDSLG